MPAGLTPSTTQTTAAENVAIPSIEQAFWRRAANRPLPGREAQRRFEPPWGFGRHFGPPPHDATPAAVTLLLYPHDGRLVVPLTLRHGSMSSHAGQVSLPGGRIESGESDVVAALRELHEELGVAGDQAVAIAPLTPLYIFGSNFYVWAWLAWADRRPTFVVNPAEVSELLEVPLDDLCDAQNWCRHRRTTRGVEQEVPHIAWQGHLIWGATAMILGEVVAMYDREAATTETMP